MPVKHTSATPGDHVLGRKMSTGRGRGEGRGRAGMAGKNTKSTAKIR